MSTKSESLAFDKKVRASFTPEQYAYISKHFDMFRDVMSEPTDEKRLGKIAEKLFIHRVGSNAGDDAVLAEKIKRFGKDTGSLEERAAHLGFTGKDAVKNFKDAYFSKDTPKSTREQWDTLLHDRYGEGAYEKTIEDLRKLEHDEMTAKIARDRERIMEGYDPETDKVIPKEWLESAFMGVFQPRQKQSYIEGRDPTRSEVAMDVLSNVAYAFPVGSLEKAIAQHVPRVVAKYGVPVVTNALAPSAVALGDYALGSKPYANAEDAAIDVGLGLATNLMANKGVAAIGSRLLGGATASAGTDKGIRKTLAQMLDGTLTEREVAKQEVREATSRAKATLSSKKPLTESDKNQLLDDLIVAEYGRMMRQDKAAKSNLLGNIAATEYSLSQKSPGDWRQIGEKPLSELNLVDALEGYYVKDMPKEVVNDPSYKNMGRLAPEQRLESLVTGTADKAKVQNPPPKPDDNLGTFIYDMPGKGATEEERKEGREYFIREALRSHPDLETLAAPSSWKLGGKGAGNLSRWAWAVNRNDVDAIVREWRGVRGNVGALRKYYGDDALRSALTAVKNFAVNKIGSDRDASKLINVIPGIDLQELRKLQEEMRKEARKKAMEKSIGGKK